ncbi:LuxR C-terminal-related transcriptional regulator [Microvirga pakistanensis]|uniref:LuxR C-terminal-related transcriptional regulator n=1 Tax=Microvirga pakistanensis TaxID=1682650 RepID=UPI00141AFFB5|nr:response regulator transcription factor [Microvirga pakistanensis]
MSLALSRPRVIIMSDVRLYREGLALILSGDASLNVVGAATPQTALDECRTLSPDVVLLDTSLQEGIGLPRRLMTQYPQLKVIAVAISEADRDIIAWAEAGAAAFVAREASTSDLIMAIHQTMRGEFVCSPRLAALLIGRLATLSAGLGSPSPATPLTKREHEIISLIETGLSNKEIACQLRIRVATVKNHIHNILEKLQLRRRGEVAARIRRDPSITPSPIFSTQAPPGL